jgi:SH3-like domain-containing protein
LYDQKDQVDLDRKYRLAGGIVTNDAQEVGRVDRGDEIEVIAEHESFLRVRTPDGLEGWVPRVVIVG